MWATVMQASARAASATVGRAADTRVLVALPPQAGCWPGQRPGFHRLSSKALLITLTDDSAIAAPATMGLR